MESEAATGTMEVLGGELAEKERDVAAPAAEELLHPNEGQPSEEPETPLSASADEIGQEQEGPVEEEEDPAKVELSRVISEILRTAGKPLPREFPQTLDSFCRRCSADETHPIHQDVLDCASQSQCY